jgi:serine/threonine protein kinase
MTDSTSNDPDPSSDDQNAEYDFSLSGSTTQRPRGTPGFAGDSDRVSGESSAISAPLGSLIGRYRIDAKLGRGGFGVVYQAFDTKLGRDVALKLAIQPQKPAKRRRNSSLLDEARASAKLDHSNVVRVYDADEWNNRIYVVMELVRGVSLSREIQVRNALSIERVLQISIGVVAALEHLHLHGIIHRDLKPSNILLAYTGEIKVTDLGLALMDESPNWYRHHLAGTRKYMSPEQVLGEVHRIDGRTDIWGFGVVLYEMLTFHSPFRETEKVDVFHSILKGEIAPPRQRRPDIPESLERLCLKCLSPRMSSRFQSAVELRSALENVDRDCQTRSIAPYASDSQATQTTHPYQRSSDLPSGNRSDTREDVAPSDTRSSSDTGSASNSALEQMKGVVPRGLRPFDARDSQTYLRLMPGPYELNGIPAILATWKEWVENDSESAEPVGVLYGPSGCGKSSFALAALIPSLDQSIKPIYCNLTVSDPIAGILAKVQQSCELARDSDSLPEALASIREQKWPYKVLLVLDQFEQYLAGGDIDIAHPLIQALRQCDGKAVQSILLVRDEFWCEISSVMYMLERPLAENSNATALPLMNLQHARRVLESFGRAYESIPSGPLSEAQRTFLEKAIQGMSRENQILCVNLAMFAELMRHHRWDTATLHRLGGAQGVLTRFLSDSFDSVRAPISHRTIRNICADILRELIPNHDLELKATAQPVSALASASNEPIASPRFKQSLQCLDQELHLIMRHQVHGQTEPHYSLTHDFLVHPVKTWLSERDAESWRGRAKTRLIQAASRFQRDPNTPHLLSISEWISATWAVPPALQSEVQRKVMAKSGSRAMRWSGLLAVFMLGMLLAITKLFEAQSDQARAKRDTIATSFNAFITAESKNLPVLWKEMSRQKDFNEQFLGQLRSNRANSNSVSLQDLLRGDLMIALAGFTPRIDRLFECLVHCDPYEYQMWEEALKSLIRRNELVQEWNTRSDSTKPLGLCELQWLFLKHDDFRLRPDFQSALDPMVEVYQLLAVADGSPDLELEKVAKQCWANSSGDSLQSRYEKILCIHLLTLMDRPRNPIGAPLSTFLQDNSTSNERALALSCQSLLSHLNQSRFYAAPRAINDEWALDRPVPEHPFTMVRIPTRELAYNVIRSPDNQQVTGFKTRVRFGGDTWLACDKASSGLFDAFDAERSGKPLPKANATSADSPMTSPQAIDIFRFCNWLSDRAGLESAYSIGREFPTPSSQAEPVTTVFVYQDDEVRWHQLANGYRLASHYEILASSVHGAPEEYWSTIGSHEVFQNRIGPEASRMAATPGWKYFPNAWGFRGLMGGLGDIMIDGNSHLATMPITAKNPLRWSVSVPWSRNDFPAFCIRLARGPFSVRVDIDPPDPMQLTKPGPRSPQGFKGVE